MAIFPGASSFQSCESWRMVDWQGKSWCDAKAGMENKRSLSPSFESHNAENKNSSELRAIVCLPRNILPPRSSRSSMSEEGEFLRTVGFICFHFFIAILLRCHVRTAYQCLVQNGTNKDDLTLTALLTEETWLRWLQDSHKLWSPVT